MQGNHNALALLQDKSVSAIAPVLSFPRWNEPFSLDRDACGMKVWSDVMQKQPDGTKSYLAFVEGVGHHRKTSNTIHQDCLAVVWTVLLSRLYLEGQYLNSCMDHNALRWNLNIADAIDYLVRRRHRFLEIYGHVVPIVYIKIQATDALWWLDDRNGYYIFRRWLIGVDYVIRQKPRREGQR